MATIKQVFELIDGVSPALNKISRAVDKVVGKFDRTAKAATSMETAAERGANGIRSAVERSASPIQMLGGLVTGLNQKLRSAVCTCDRRGECLYVRTQLYLGIA